MTLLKKKQYKVLFFITVVIVLILALIPSDHIDLDCIYEDKIKHATAFFVLSLLLNRASSTLQHRLRNVGALLIFGVIIEFLQSLTPNREASFNDVVADLVGILLFQLLYSLYRFIKELRNQN
ncbi:MAG: VanZ family protein [Epsilonproteobacteria bacterium]|nr:VanZ family protein [Campylobacterota bacterium]